VIIGVVGVLAVAVLFSSGFSLFPGENIPPVLRNLGVDFAPYNPTTGKAGAFIFENSVDKVFLEFGAEVSGEYGPKILPTFEYIVDPNANVYAVCDGVVVEVEFQTETQDYSIGIRPTANSIWLINHDHVLSPTVSKGDEVTAGQVIGKPGTQSQTLGRTEIMVVEETSGGEIAYASFKLFDSSLLDNYQQRVWQLMSDWENFKGDSSIYDENSMVYAGCLYERLRALTEGAEVIE